MINIKPNKQWIKEAIVKTKKETSYSSNPLVLHMKTDRNKLTNEIVNIKGLLDQLEAAVHNSDNINAWDKVALHELISCFHYITKTSIKEN